MRSFRSGWLGIIFLFTISPLIYGEELQETITFSASDVQFTTYEAYTMATIAGGQFPDARPGTPRLPIVTKNILLPVGATYTGLTYTSSERTIVDQINLMPAQPFQSMNDPAAALITPDPEISEQTSPWPDTQISVAAVQTMRGRTIVTVNIHPLRYIPFSRQLLLAERVNLTVQYDFPARAATEPASPSPLFANLINEMVINPESITRDTAFGTNQIDYVIITEAALTNAFQTLADYRTNTFGTGRTGVISLEDILAASSGLDAPDKLRNYIRELVSSNNTDYIILGGDNTIVPVRYCFAIDGDGDSENLPTDLYYAGLDGTWDANNNQIYGELVDNVDMLPEIIVSRIPIRTEDEALAYITKVIQQEEGSYDDLETRLLLTGTKGWNLWYGSTRSSDFMLDSYSQFRDHQPVSDVEEWVRRLHHNSMQPYWSAGELNIFFDTLTTWDEEQAGDFQQTADRFEEVYNLGWEHYYYLTHGSEDGFGIEMVDGNDMFTIENLQNVTNMVSFIATPACQTAHFDSETDPCFAEAFLRKPDAGAVIYFAHARNGQGEQISSYGGPTPAFIAQYYQCLFSNCNTFGEASTASKSQLIGLCSTNGGWRWTQFGLNLLGDAALTVYPSGVPHPPILESAVTTNVPSLSILVGWDDLSSNETGFEIQRRTPETDWAYLASAIPASTQYVDSTITSNQFYLYRLRATNAAGQSLFSNEGGLIAGILPSDAWDPTDDSPAGASDISTMAVTNTAHGPHTLSTDDTNDWFSFDVESGQAYWISTYAEENVGGLYARVYDSPDATNLIASDGDTNGLGHFAFYLTPEEDGTYYLQIEPNSDRDSAQYNLYYRSDIDSSGAEAIAEALGTPDLEWTTSKATGDPWFAQTNVTHDSESAMRSGQVYYNETSWLETVISDEGNLRLWFKLDSVTNSDYLVFYFNGQNPISFSGLYDWSQVCYYITEVTTVRVEFARSYGGSSGTDAAWLDDVSLTPFEEYGPNERISDSLQQGSKAVYNVNISASGTVMAFVKQGFEGMNFEVYDSEQHLIAISATPSGFLWTCTEAGTYMIMVNASGGSGEFSLYFRQRHAPLNDFDGDAISDLALYYPPTGNWSVYGSAGEQHFTDWGAADAIPVPGDYDGDRTSDIAVYFPENGAWVVNIDSTPETINWGWNETIPVQADYNGDGATQPAVYHPPTGQWHIWSDETPHVQNWGWAETIPVPGDFDGDGRADFCVYWPPQGKWYILYANGQTETRTMGWTETAPMAADINGDLADDLILYWPQGGIWYVLISGTDISVSRNFGWDETIPAPAQYFEGYTSSLAAYWPTGGQWYIRDADNQQIITIPFGWSAALPAYPQYWINQRYRP